MSGIFHRAFNKFGKLSISMHLVLSSVLLLASFPAPGFGADKTPEPGASAKGQRVLICGHSFHVFVGAPIAKIADAAGIKDHVNSGTQSIGGSTVTQHWDLADPAHPNPKNPKAKNIVKEHLTAG